MLGGERGDLSSGGGRLCRSENCYEQLIRIAAGIVSYFRADACREGIAIDSNSA